MPTLATINDLKTISKMVSEFYSEESYPYNEKEIEKNLETLLSDNRLGNIFLIKDENQTAGYCMVINSFCLELGGKIGYIDELFVKKESRNKRLSTNCLNYIIESYRLNKYASLRLEVEIKNYKTIEYYKRFNFSPHQRILMSFRL